MRCTIAVLISLLKHLKFPRQLLIEFFATSVSHTLELGIFFVFVRLVASESILPNLFFSASLFFIVAVQRGRRLTVVAHLSAFVFR